MTSLLGAHARRNQPSFRWIERQAQNFSAASPSGHVVHVNSTCGHEHVEVVTVVGELRAVDRIT